MTDWTDPQHVAAGTASSSQFNTETVDNLTHLWERLGRVLTFSAINPTIPTGTGADTTLTTLAEVDGNDDLDYSVAAGVITLNDAGLWLFCHNAYWATGTGGAMRWTRVQGSTLINILQCSAPIHTVTDLGTGAARAVNVPAGETIRVHARQDSGVNKTLVARLTLVYFGPT